MQHHSIQPKDKDSAKGGKMQTQGELKITRQSNEEGPLRLGRHVEVNTCEPVCSS